MMVGQVIEQFNLNLIKIFSLKDVPESFFEMELVMPKVSLKRHLVNLILYYHLKYAQPPMK